MLFDMYLPVETISGEGCVGHNADKFASLGKTALIVTSANAAAKSGALGDVTAALSSAGIEYGIYNKITANPLLSACFEAGEMAKELGAEFVIGIGGGSALDASRAAAVFAAGNYAQSEDIYKDFSRMLPLVCIGTTAGTGSEVDGSAVLTVDETGKKRSISGTELYARYAFCDSRYTATMNLRNTVSTGLDALCHALESWFSTDLRETSGLMSRRATELIYPWLKKMSEGWFDPEDMDMRRDMYYGSLWAGLTIGLVGTGFPHPMGYILTENGGVPHGAACAIFEKEFLIQSLKEADPAEREKLFAITGGEEPLYKMLDILSANDITISSEAALMIKDRLASAKNTARTLGVFNPEIGMKLAERMFLNLAQDQPVDGDWTFGN